MEYAPPIPREEPPPPPRRRNVAIPLLVGILILALGLAGYVVYTEVGKKSDNNAGQDPSNSTTTTSAAPSSATSSQVLEIPARPREDRPSWLPSNNWKLLTQRGLHELWYSQDESEGGNCQATDSELHVTSVKQGLTGCSLKDPLNVSLSDVGIEAKVHRQAGCAGIWARTGDRGYTVGVCDGVIRLYALGDNAPSQDNELASWPVKIDGDPYVTLVAIGTEISVWVNGQKLGTKNHDLIKRGKVNLGAFTAADPADVTFSEVRVWQPQSTSGGGNPTTNPTPSRSGWSNPPSTTPTPKPTSTKSST
jgi:hypothetical protein